MATDHEDEYERVMGARPGPEDLVRIIYRNEFRLLGCLVFLLAVLLLTGFALQWVAGR